MISILISSSLIIFLYADSGYDTYEPQSFYDGGGYYGDEGVAGCCECTESSEEPYCNEECDNTICSYDPYCCNEEYGSWDWICAAAAVNECNGDQGGDEWNYGYDYYEPPTASAECCECTESSDSPFCNEGCDANICSYDPYCCNVQWDWICANSAKDECAASSGGDYQDSYEYNYYDDYDNGYDGGDYDQCNCDEICYGQEPEDWEFEYEEVPPCIIDNCGQQLDTCAADDSCVEGIEGIVSQCYADNEDPMQCMDGLVQDTENNGFTQLCDGNEECGADLKSLGECVVNSANYGFCPEEEYKKLKLKSVLKTIKKRSRSRKRKSASAKQKLSRKSRKSKLSKRTKKRGKRASKLRKARRKLQSTEGYDGSDDYENPEYDYGCYCDCGDEEEEIPPCILDNCGDQLYACGGSDACINGVEGVIEQCYENNDAPQECMDELMKESNGAQAIELCGGDEEAAGHLQALGTCVINSANYGFCSEDEYKKLKVKALVKATKKVRARKAASKQRKARLSKRARSAKARTRTPRSKRARPRSRRAAASAAKARAQRQRQRRARSQKSRKQRSRKSRRKLQSYDDYTTTTYEPTEEPTEEPTYEPESYYDGDEGVTGCCECTKSSDEPYCNSECDNTICSYDPYCCNEDYGSWDWICAAAAVNECNGDKGGNGFDSWNYSYDFYAPPTASAECCECTDSSDSPFCNEGCDANICSYDPYCCNVQWDWICANSAKDECAASGNSFKDGTDSYNYGGYGYDGDSYQMQDSYDFGGYGDSYDTGFDSYYPPTSKQRSRRSRVARASSRSARSVKARAQRQRQKRSRSRARSQRSRKARTQRQRSRKTRGRTQRRSRRKLLKATAPKRKLYHTWDIPSKSDYGYGGYQDSYPPTSGDYDFNYGGSGDYDYYDGGYYGGYNYYDTTGGVYDYDYDYYAPSSYDYYDIDGNNYNYDYYGQYDGDSYDIGDYDYDYDYDYEDSYQPPSSKRRSRRIASRKQRRRQSRQRPRSRARGSKQRRGRRQRRARPVKRRQTSRRQRMRRARR